MIIANGKFTKKAYCNNCFSIIEWEVPEAELSVSGHKVIKCPVCGAYVKVKKFEYVEKDVIEKPAAMLNGIAYETLADALNAAKDGDTVTLDQSTTLNSITLKKDMTLDLNTRELTISGTVYARGNTVIKNGSIANTRKTDLFYVSSADHSLTLEDVEFDSQRNGITAIGGIITLNNCIGTSQEALVYPQRNATVIVNGGTYSARDNGVIMDNGNTGNNNNKIIINDGYFVGHITSAGYLAHIIYLANDDELTIKDGTFVVEDGSAIVVRAGQLYVGPNVDFEVGGTSSGKVGDGAQAIPAGHEIVIDTKSNYPAVASLDVKAGNHEIFEIKAE